MIVRGLLAAILVAISIAAPSAGRADVLKLDVAFDVPIRTPTPAGEVLEVSGAKLMARPGEPLLPQRTFYFVLPHGHAPAELRLESIRAKPLPGVFEIAPAQRPVPLSRSLVIRLTPPEPSIYGSDDPRPGVWAVMGSVQYKHGFALVPVTVHPLSYQPRSGSVVRLVSATLALTTRPWACRRTS